MTGDPMAARAAMSDGNGLLLDRGRDAEGSPMADRTSPGDLSYVESFSPGS
jgi:hypothetical protein